MFHTRSKRKKGFSLMECVVALLLFSIITGSVLTVFSVSRNQIKTQNDKYRVDLMANNILSAFESTDGFDSFSNILKTSLNINLDGSETDGGFMQTVGTGGTGQYGFDVNNVPVAIPFSKIVVKKDEDGKQYAIFRNKDNTENLVAFEGTYPDNKLQDNPAFSFKVSEMYTESENGPIGKMTLKGTAHSTFPVTIDGKLKRDFSFSITYDVSKNRVYFTMEKGSADHALGDFDKYLLDNNYFLKCLYGSSVFGYYFQVFNAKENTPVTLRNGEFLYYHIDANSSLINGDSATCGTQLSNFAQGDNTQDNYYFDMRHHTVTYAYGSAFSTELNYKELDYNNGKEYTEDNKRDAYWYFFPWLVYRNDKDIQPSPSDVTRDPNRICHEYTPKAELKDNIYYVLNSSDHKEMLLFNSDGQVIFPYTAANTALPLKNLQDNCGFGVDGGRNGQDVYNEKDYDKWYKKGSVPAKEITQVKMDAAALKIVFYSGTDPYITFKYAGLENGKEIFEEDCRTILDFGGYYSNYYNYSKTYTWSKSGLKDSQTISDWQTVGKIATKLGQTFKASTKTVQYYRRDWQGGAIIGSYRYRYYTYTATINAANQIDSINLDKTLTVTSNGGEFSYSGTETAQAAFNKVSSTTIAPNQNKTDTSGSKLILASADVQTQVDDITPYAPDASGSNAAVLAFAQEKWNTSSANGTATDTKAITEKPADFFVDNLGDWLLQGEPTKADLHTVGVLSSFIEDEDAFNVQIGDETVFTAHTTDFEITAADFSANKFGCTYEIVDNDAADIESKTYYITWTSGDMALVAVATYSNYTKEVEGAETFTEPKIAIWRMPIDKKPANVKLITGEAYNTYLYRAYRKG